MSQPKTDPFFRPRPGWPLWVSAAGLLLLVTVATRLMAALVLHDFANSADEWAYHYQAQVFALGQFTAEAHPFQEQLNPFYIIVRDGQVFSIFPPGWPALLSLGFLLHAAAWVNPFLTGISTLLVAWIAYRLADPQTAMVAGGLYLGSAWVWFNGASGFAHPACHVCLLGTVACLLQPAASRSGLYAIAAGLLAGLAFTIREYTTLLVLLPWLVHAVTVSDSPMRTLAGMAAASLLPLSLYAMTNTFLSGEFWMPPRFLLDGEGLGFGERVIRVFDYTETVVFTPWDGLQNTGANLGRLFLWTFPGLPLLAVWGLWNQRSRPETWLMASSTVLLIAGYSLYPSDGGNQYGPRFYFESAGFLAVLGAFGLLHLQRTLALPDRLRILLAILLATAVLGQFTWHSRSVEQQIEDRMTLFRLVQQRRIDHAIVFVNAPSGDMTQGDLIRNAPGTPPDVLFAWDLGPRNHELLTAFPDRVPYRFERHPVTGAYSLKPLPSRVGEMQRP